MKNDLLSRIRGKFKEFEEEILSISSNSNLLEIRNKYIGKEGIFTKLTEEFKLLKQSEKKIIGSELVTIKKNINKIILEKANFLLSESSGLPFNEFFDPYLKKITDHASKGLLHPYTESLYLIEKIFLNIGFDIINGSILTDEYANFTSLNIPDDHPARETHDTFWVKEKELLLRTHTSNVQVAEACKRKPPFGFISSGLVYRNEATDVSHDFMFAQLEGVYVGEDASISSLLYILKLLLNAYFEKEDLNVSARPGIFPFVEPGLEIYFECPFCHDGCGICKQSRWIEIGGAGIIHQNVRREMNLADDKIGWAFGMGLTRMVMLKYNISDIRLLHNNVVLI